ncbi:hypothetical protein [Kineosporia mesophila]|uniref:hypothetical protein n=1 Tax=Kineosporia mesophila TaxID=566012 RepID=UPI001E343195|nr:hypothetical protein [Kineosporia mesophila]MCD5349618.1 hypothetical protein [Kineosporia mesophila]
MKVTAVSREGRLVAAFIVSGVAPAGTMYGPCGSAVNAELVCTLTYTCRPRGPGR